MVFVGCHVSWLRSDEVECDYLIFWITSCNELPGASGEDLAESCDLSAAKVVELFAEKL